MYVCGPTVYDQAHLGHARAAYIFEVIRTYLEYQGYKVKFVKNITDVDDKIIAQAKKEFPTQEIDKACAQVAKKYTRRYYEDMDALGIRHASIRPFATKHIGQMVKYIAGLIKKGYAYESEGSVYFDVRKFKEYGALSGQDIEAMRSAARIEKDEKKKDQLDFALWKKAKENEPFWRSPWGAGRPGWHIECSVMSSKYLGNEFDIHGGGRDLIFPHHENEIAQSRCYSGKTFARVWLHNGLLTINGQKMAKSLGNFVSIRDFLKNNVPEVMKIFFLSAHYRSPIDYNDRSIDGAKKSLERFQVFYSNLLEKLDSASMTPEADITTEQIKTFKNLFDEAMEDDFNTPKALAALYAMISFCNKSVINYEDSMKRRILNDANSLLNKCGRVFGIDFSRFASKKDDDLSVVTEITRRKLLREQGNFSEADQIRKKLEAKGIILEDTKEGTTWRRKV